MMAVRKKSGLRFLLRLPVWLYRLRLGWLLGHRFLMLTHVGRRTGLRRQTVLEVVEYRRHGPEAVVMSGFGRDSDWLLNIQAKPNVEVTIGLRHFEAAFRFLDEEEAVRVFAGYERRNRVAAPLVRRVLSRLLGWHYAGSADEHRRLVRQLPLLAFRPRKSPL